MLSSHQLYQVQRVCHSVGILSKGKIVIEGAIDQLGREALSGGRYRIEVETVSPDATLVAVIRKINGVRDVNVQENMLLINTDADLRAKISKAVVQHDFPLIQMKIQQFSLDDIYMKYFKEN